MKSFANFAEEKYLIAKEAAEEQEIREKKEKKKKKEEEKMEVERAAKKKTLGVLMLFQGLRREFSSIISLSLVYWKRKTLLGQIEFFETRIKAAAGAGRFNGVCYSEKALRRQHAFYFWTRLCEEKKKEKETLILKGLIKEERVKRAAHFVLMISRIITTARTASGFRIWIISKLEIKKERLLDSNRERYAAVSLWQTDSSRKRTSVLWGFELWHGASNMRKSERTEASDTKIKKDTGCRFMLKYRLQESRETIREAYREWGEVLRESKILKAGLTLIKRVYSRERTILISYALSHW